MMEYSERVLSASGEVELDPNIVSEEAGKLYSELQAVIETHGEGVVESLLPILVWVLEGLAGCKAQLREREEEAEREKAEREALLERYLAERSLRKESQERCLELEDQMEQERRTMRAREKERERRERDLEKKAREQADQLVALEEQKNSLSREMSSLRISHNKLSHTHREMMEKKRDSERDSAQRSPASRTRARPKNGEFQPSLSDSDAGHQVFQRPHANSGPPCLEDFVPKEESGIDIVAKCDQFVHDIVSSTPELREFHASTLLTPGEPPTGEPPTGVMAEDAREAEEGEEMEGGGPDEEELEDESVEWELRNTDSVFSELSELSRDYVESVDRGVSIRGSSDQFEEILAQNEELKVNHELVDAARKALISRVVELTDDREALKLEVSSLLEAVSRLEGRVKEKDEENKRLRGQTEDEDQDALLPSSMRHFSRSEMARVVMEKNQYKQRLFELQEAVRRSQTLRASKEERLSDEGKSSVWRKFNRFFNLSKEPLILPSTPSYSPQTSPSIHRPPRECSHLHSVKTSEANSSSSPRARRREVYKEVRSHIWASLGKRQLHGWSVPLGNLQVEERDDQEQSPAPDVPVLTQLRLLDHRDSTAKMNCAAAVPPEISGDATCSVWVVSGPHSCSEMIVIDPARSNTVQDHFILPPTASALCICAVPPIGQSPGTVWIGTQEGSILVHPASGGRRRCLHSVSLSESVHSLTVSQNKVIAGLGNGTLAFFSISSGHWNLQTHSVLPLGANPLQPVRCCLAKSGRLWVGYWNKVHVVEVESRRMEQVVSVSERSEQQVRFLCAAGSGVWTSCRLDPILRLLDWSTGRPLQQVDFTAVVTKTLGQAFLTLSPLQISSLTVVSGRLWVGTGGGAIFSIPLSITSEDLSIPYCSTAAAQLCFHGHRQAVRFIIGAPGCLITSPDTAVTTSLLVVSGGEGYINFRMGDDASDDSVPSAQTTPQRSERSHMLIWQIPASPQ